MSSPRPMGAKPVRRSVARVRPAGARSPTHGAEAPASKVEYGAEASAQASRLAGELERALAAGKPDVLSPEALQVLMGAVCRTYAAQVEAGSQALPLPARGGATATDVMVTASGMLKAANLAVFELGMWQSFTGR